MAGYNTLILQQFDVYNELADILERNFSEQLCYVNATKHTNVLCMHARLYAKVYIIATYSLIHMALVTCANDMKKSWSLV